MSRTLKGTAVVGLSVMVLALTAATANADTAASGFQPATSADAPYISRDFAYSGGALYNNAPASGTSHSVTTSVGSWTTPPGNGRRNFTFVGNGNGKTVTCSVYGIGLTTYTIYNTFGTSGSNSTVGHWVLPQYIDLTGVSETVLVNATCDIPSATASGAYSVLWGVQYP